MGLVFGTKEAHGTWFKGPKLSLRVKEALAFFFFKQSKIINSVTGYSLGV